MRFTLKLELSPPKSDRYAVPTGYLVEIQAVARYEMNLLTDSSRTAFAAPLFARYFHNRHVVFSGRGQTPVASDSSHIVGRHTVSRKQGCQITTASETTIVFEKPDSALLWSAHRLTRGALSSDADVLKSAQGRTAVSCQ